MSTDYAARRKADAQEAPVPTPGGIQNLRPVYQVVMEQQASPAGVMLVAIDRGAGLDVWLRPHEDPA
jgi:hypothetical protein